MWAEGAVDKVCGLLSRALDQVTPTISPGTITASRTVAGALRLIHECFVVPSRSLDHRRNVQTGALSQLLVMNYRIYAVQLLCWQAEVASTLPMSRPWEEFVMSRDPSGRLFVARCSLCGQLIAASPDRTITEKLASSHRCDMRVPIRATAPRT